MLHTPHSPYIAKRDTLDDGFSKGWGLHFQPSEEYVIDAHVHARIPGGKEDISAVLDKWFDKLEAFRLAKLIALVQDEAQFEAYREVTETDNRLAWMFWPSVLEPNLAAVQKALSCGACGIKLLNDKIMRGEAPLESWETPAWQEIFAYLNEKKVPVLWHVTQRVGYSPYHGGGYNSYFAQGQEKGIFVTNEQLLAQFERIMQKYPDIPMIGAHQLYLGLDRLKDLFERYPQLHLDTTVGFFVRWCDTIYEEDRVVYYDFVQKYADRLLFGTDTSLTPESVCDYQKEGFLSHLRFIHQLRLPWETLQKICYGNAEHLLRLKPSDPTRKYNSRP